jgi:hypothetical protein
MAIVIEHIERVLYNINMEKIPPPYRKPRKEYSMRNHGSMSPDLLIDICHTSNHHAFYTPSQACILHHNDVEA